MKTTIDKRTEKILKFKKVLNRQLEKGIITKYVYNKQMDWLRDQPKKIKIRKKK